MCEGNHRMVALLDSYVDWILLIVNYVSLKDDEDTRLCFVWQTVHENWPSNPKFFNFGFEIRHI